MKRLLFVTVFIIGTALSGQTTSKEFKYAKEGYLLLLELGIPDARYDFVPIEEFTYYPQSDDTVNMYKMIRTVDSSIAAIVLLETKKDYRGDIETKCIGVSLNTSKLSIKEAEEALIKVSKKTNLPVTDPIRFGVELICKDLLENLKKKIK